MMSRLSVLLLAAAALVAPVASAQAAGQAEPQGNFVQSQPAPVERAYPDVASSADADQSATLAVGKVLTTGNGTAAAQPAQGVYLRVGHDSAVREVAQDAQHVELRVERGIANLNVQDPANDDLLILVDLPGGQTQILKNGVYTFNAATNTVRVLKGEAQAYPGSDPNARPVRIKDAQALVLSGPNVRAKDFTTQEASLDLVPGPYAYSGTGYPGPNGYGPYGYGPYGDGFYGYPYAYPYAFAYGYPWGWGYPYGWYGYPIGIGLGFGYWGGFHGYWGGFHGGWGGGFHGRR